MKKLILLFWLTLCSPTLAQQISGPLPTNALACAFNTAPPTVTSGFWGYVQCDTNGKLITSGGGGGGLSVQDQAAWTQGTSNMTPQGCEFNDTSTLTSGTQGTTRCTTKRAQIIDTDTTGNALYTAINSPSPAIAGTTPTTQTAVGSGATSKIQTDLNGNLYIAPSQVVNLAPTTTALSLSTIINSQYPVNSVTTTPTAVTASTTGTTTATAATMAATASVTNFVCGFDITADATALATGTAVLSGTISGSLSYLQTVQAVASGTSVLSRTFNPCIPASAANTAITITSAAAGTGGNTIVNIFGYRL